MEKMKVTEGVNESLYEGESVADSDRSGPESQLLNGKSFLLGHQQFNRRLFKVEPKKETIKMGTTASPTLINLSDAKLAFKVLLPTYPHLVIYPAQGFIGPKKKVILNVFHEKLENKKESEIKSIIKTLPPIIIACFEVANCQKNENIEDLLIFENGTSPLTVWSELQICVSLN